MSCMRCGAGVVFGVLSDPSDSDPVLWRSVVLERHDDDVADADLVIEAPDLDRGGSRILVCPVPEMLFGIAAVRVPAREARTVRRSPVVPVDRHHSVCEVVSHHLALFARPHHPRTRRSSIRLTQATAGKGVTPLTN